MLFDSSAFCSPLPDDVQVFASGVNRESEIRGFAHVAIPIGVSVNRLNQRAIDTLIELEQPVMVDSGAFSEVTVTPAGLRTKATITGPEWRRRLGLYLHLASALREKALLVVPDKVGDQQETLARLVTHRRELAAIASTGARLLLPLQTGEKSHEEFFKLAQNVTGLPLIPAMPMRKAATTPEALFHFLEAARPSHVHLLGIGIENYRYEGLIRAIRHFCPEMSISMDSNRLRAVVGKDRPLTRLESELRSAPAEHMFGAVESPVFTGNGETWDYTDLIASPSLWASPEQFMAIADVIGLVDPVRETFVSSPDEFLQTPCPGFEDLVWIEHPLLAYEFDRAWQQFIERRIRFGVRSAAIASVFQDSRLRSQKQRAA